MYSWKSGTWSEMRMYERYRRNNNDDDDDRYYDDRIPLRHDALIVKNNEAAAPT